MRKLEIAQKLRQARLTAGMTQMDVARKIGRPQQTIGGWETARSQPDADTLAVLFRLYRMDANDFYEYDPQAPNVVEMEMLRRYRALDAHGRELVDMILEKEGERVRAQARPRQRSRADDAAAT